MPDGVAALLFFFGLILISFALAWVIIFVCRYISTREDSVGRIGFGTFKALYNANPERWHLWETYVTSKIYEEEEHGDDWIIERTSSEADYYFSFLDYARYRLWKRRRDKLEQREKNNAVLEKHIQAWREDLAAYAERMGVGFAEPEKDPTSTDPKPLYAPHGTCIQESDTKDVYVFDAEKKEWIRVFRGGES